MFKMIKMLLQSAVISVLSAMLLYGAWLLTRMCVMDYFTIPTSSMCPTLQPGDKVVVNKLTMGARIYTNLDFKTEGQKLECVRMKGLRTIRHNDIAVFTFPHHDWRISFIINNVYCKRIVALPGDSLSIVDGRYHNNCFEGVLGLEHEQDILSSTPDSLIWQGSLSAFPFDDHFQWTIKEFGPMYIPIIGDIMNITPKEACLYRILLEWELDKEIVYDWELGKVWAAGQWISRHQWQHNYYFMAGDNVMDSNDSRYWGLVPAEYIVGVVTWIERAVANNYRIKEVNNF